MWMRGQGHGTGQRRRTCAQKHQAHHAVQRHPKERRDRGPLLLAEVVRAQLHDQRPVRPDRRLEDAEAPDPHAELRREDRQQQRAARGDDNAADQRLGLRATARGEQPLAELRAQHVPGHEGAKHHAVPHHPVPRSRPLQQHIPAVPIRYSDLDSSASKLDMQRPRGIWASHRLDSPRRALQSRRPQEDEDVQRRLDQRPHHPEQCQPPIRHHLPTSTALQPSVC